MPSNLPLPSFSTSALLILALTRTSSAKLEHIWHVSVLEAPAPPPGKGAPLQASALRDTSYLPAQIASIAAAYVLALLFIGSALLFVGRRLRRAAQGSPTTLAMEMVRPVKPNVPQAFDPSPISPATSKNLYGPSPADTFDMKNNWPSPNKNNRESSGWGSTARGHTRRAPSYQGSVVTFDESVIEDDKERNEREMERLYAAVMQHDEHRASSGNVAPQHRPLGQHPPELQHLRDVNSLPQSPPRSETTSPVRTLTKSPRSNHRPTPISIHSHNSSRSSLGSFTKKRGLRNLAISPPMGSPEIVPDYGYSENEPLSPRIYDEPGPPPPTPPQRRMFNEREDRRETRLSPRDARFPDNPLRSPRTVVPAVPAVPVIQTIPEIQQPLPPPPSTTFGKQYTGRDPNKPKRTPAPLALRTQAASNSSGQTLGSNLRTAPLPLRNPYPTNLNASRPESMIKATVLETKGPGHSLRTPRTGVPMTPYSPYMPFTPLTPMTPSRLVTRQERKRRDKEEGKRVMTAEDAVTEEPDAWADVS